MFVPVLQKLAFDRVTGLGKRSELCARRLCRRGMTRIPASNANTAKIEASLFFFILFPPWRSGDHIDIFHHFLIPDPWTWF